jgi:COP9 signalosome complex subunit 1
MDGELLMDLDNDVHDEGNGFDLPLELIPSSFNEVESTKNLEANADYIDYAKLENEYQNPALSYRLLHMFEVCVNRRPEIAKVINRVHSKNSIDVEFYRTFATALEKHKNADSSKSWPTIDTAWIQATEDEVQAMTERESANLKKAQDEGIKENIRIAMVKLFDIGFRSGKFYEAAKLYSRSLRDYCNSPKTVVPMLLSHVKVLMYMQDYLRVETYCSQAERAIADCQERVTKYDRNTAIFPRNEKESKAMLQAAVCDKAKVDAVMAIVKMCNKNYLAAADKFVSVDHEVFEFPELLSTTDIAYYGCFCALASYDRNQLKEKVINNGNFRKYTEPEGKLVDLIQAFRNNSFTTVFQLLEEMRPLLLLNIYIAGQQKQLYKLIRRRAFVQYISTFGIISLPTMAKVFRTDTNELIDELVDLIDNGIIDARIDPIEEKLYRLEENATQINSQRIAKIQKDLEERARILILRAALAIHGVNPAKEMEAEMDSGMGRGRRRMAPFGHDDDGSDEDVEMVTQTQQLSFGNGRSFLNRMVNRFTSSGRQGTSSSTQNPPPPVAGIGNPNDQGLSDTDMMDP